MILPKLTPRLQKIYDIVPSCQTVCDIGTDHGYIPVCLTLSGKCKTAIASDIKKGPVERAKATVSRYNADSCVSVRLGKGLETIREDEADIAVIAGMGGLLIADILNSSKLSKRFNAFIFQPMTAIGELREYLNTNGYTIEKEYIVREDEKLYNIFCVIPQKDKPYTISELYMGKNFASDENLNEYKKQRQSKLNKQIEGLSLSKNSDTSKRLEKLIALREMILNENK